MEANVEFYGDWFLWLEKRSAELAKEPLTLLALTAAVAGLVKEDVALFKSLSDCFHGASWGIPIKLGRWAAKNGDPLKVTREKMRAIRATYGEGEHVQK